MKNFYLLLFIFAGLCGCSTTDKAVFITKTSISVLDVETTPANVTFAYDRQEGFIGPSYPNGAAPSVVGSFKSDGAIINPKIKQVYATGDAADIVTSAQANNTEHNNLLLYHNPDEKKMMFFGTSTSLGIKVGLDQNNPAFLLGFKRKEASYIPLQGNNVRGGQRKDVYASVLASIDTDLSGSPTDMNFKNGQFFATGKAAKILAGKDYIQESFAEKAKFSFDQSFDSQTRSQGDATRCSFNVKKDDWNIIIQSGLSSGVLSKSELKDEILAAHQAYQNSGDAKDQLTLIQMHNEGMVGAVDGMSETTTILLTAHRDLVCDLANKQ
jgi:hypothetical protein